MEREFRFKQERKELADRLRKERQEKGIQSAQNELKKAKEEEPYKHNKALQMQARGISKEAIANANRLLEIEDDPEKWEIVELKDKIPAEIKKFIDSELISRAKGDIWGMDNFDRRLEFFGVEPLKERADFFGYHETRDKLAKKCIEFVNSISGGRFLDPHNFNHVVGGQSVPEGKETFDRYSSIIPSGHEYRPEYWIAGRGNGYAVWPGKPVVICSPLNPTARRFIEQQTDGNRWIPKSIEYFMKAEEIPEFPSNPGESIPLSKEYAAAAQEGNGYSWIDIADCIVDLKAEKMWVRKYSEAEKKEVETDIEAYRSGRKKLAGR